MRWYVLRSPVLSDEEYVEQVRKNFDRIERWRWWLIAMTTAWMLILGSLVSSVVGWGTYVEIKAGIPGYAIAKGFSVGFGAGVIYVLVVLIIPMINFVLLAIPPRTEQLLLKYADELRSLREDALNKTDGEPSREPQASV